MGRGRAKRKLESVGTCGEGTAEDSEPEKGNRSEGYEKKEEAEGDEFQTLDSTDTNESADATSETKVVQRGTDPQASSREMEVEQDSNEGDEEEKDKNEDDDDDDEEGEFEVETILHRHHHYKRHYYYYVKWKGYDETENTWEPKENLNGCPQLRDDFDQMLEKLQKDDVKEHRRRLATSLRFWRKYGGKVVTAAGNGEEKKEEELEEQQQQPECGEDAAVVGATDSNPLTSTPNPRKRKSEDDEDEQQHNPRDSSAKKPKLTTQSLMKKWLEKGAKTNKIEVGSPPASPNASSASSTASPSVSSPALNKVESFNKLFKSPFPTKKSVSEITVKKVLGCNNGISDDTVNTNNNGSKDHDDDIAEKKQQQKALKRWENEMNSISKDPAKIVVENLVDSDGPPSRFTYINDYLPFDDIIFPDDPLIGCECAECDVKGCCPNNNDAQMVYNKYKRLRNYISSKDPIWECNRLCKCGPDCRNRVVQRGRQVDLCIFKTDNGRGWGVKTRQNIRAGTYVTTYLGELINHDEAERRGKEYDVIGNTYLFDLDYADSDTCYTVDAAHYGNVSHFINHSCDPNLEIHNVFINNIDVSMPYLALFSCRDIAKGEELSFDYLMSGATEDTDDVLDVSALENASMSESRYDADRSSEDSEIFISAFETFVEDDDSTANGKVSATPTGGTNATSDSNNGDKENVTPKSFIPAGEKLSVSTKNAQSTNTSKSTSASTVNSSPRQKLLAQFDASTPRRSPAKKALDKKTPCLCGTAKCRGFLMV